MLIEWVGHPKNQDESVLEGQLLDQGSNPLPGVSLTIRSLEDSQEQTVQSDSDGFFLFKQLKQGKHVIIRADRLIIGNVEV